MKNTLGNEVSITLFGESHGPLIGVVLDGIPAGYPIDRDRIWEAMEKRKAKSNLSTKRQEDDLVRIVSGIFNETTTGQAITFLVENHNTRSVDYQKTQGRLRPGHADFVAFEKYHGFQDWRGGGHFSGRLTAPIVAAGALCAQILEQKGVLIGSHIAKLHQLEDDAFSTDIDQLTRELIRMNQTEFAVLNEQVKEQMIETIQAAANQGDSVGGHLETVVLGLPVGLGQPAFDSVESILSHALFSIPAVKGVSFGLGFDFANLKGSQANDPFIMKEGRIQTSSNHNGGINGGITNGMPLVINTVIKPTSSIYLPQQSVDYETKEAVQLQIHGRHDPAIIHRARIVVDSMVAIALLDLWMTFAAEESFVCK